MRVRLLGIVVSLVVLVVLGLGVPLALSVASAKDQTLFVDRLTDTERFASLAQRPLIDGVPGSLDEQLNRYEQVYGIRVAVLNQNSQAVFHSHDLIDLDDPVVKTVVGHAQAGNSQPNGPSVLPWTTGTYVVAAPVLVDGELRGVAVTVSDTSNLRASIALWWALIAAGAAVAIGIALAAALPVVRWILRPVRQLDEATAELTNAVVSGYEVHPIVGRGGPAELRRLSASFDRMAETVGSALSTQRSFVADASHQLRNPLTVLGLELDNLAHELDSASAGHYRAARSEYLRLRQVVEELLNLARAESWQVEPVPVDVDRVVLAGIGHAQDAARPRDIVVKLLGDPGGHALAPKDGLTVMLEALLDNAVKYTADGTEVDVEVRRTTRDDGEWVGITVRDHGTGLRPDELERATDRFWRSSSHANVPGSGLGLAIVDRLVTRVGGAIALDLPEEGGLRVRIELPAVPGPDQVLLDR